MLVLLAFALCCSVGWGQPFGRLRGTVTDPNHASILGATVSGKSATGIRIQTTTRTGGEFKFTDLQPGTYVIEVSRDGFLGTVVEAIRVRINAETVVPPVELQVDPSPTGCRDGPPPIVFDTIEAARTEITGSLRPFEKSRGLAGVAIVLSDPKTKRVVITTRSDLSGKFTIANVRPGVYTLTARAKGFADFIVDSVEVKRARRTRVRTIEMMPCDGAACPPVKEVHHPGSVCL